MRGARSTARSSATSHSLSPVPDRLGTYFHRCVTHHCRLVLSIVDDHLDEVRAFRDARQIPETGLTYWSGVTTDKWKIQLPPSGRHRCRLTGQRFFVGTRF